MRSIERQPRFGALRYAGRRGDRVLDFERRRRLVLEVIAGERAPAEGKGSVRDGRALRADVKKRGHSRSRL
jgi:hypothetical protein